MVGKLLIFTLLTAQISFGQSNTVAGGGDLSGVGGSISYTVGQIDYQAISSATGILTQGVQQPYEILSIDINTLLTFHKTFNAILYPNPSIGVVKIKITEESWDNLSYELYNLQGKLIQTAELSAAITSIDISTIEDGSYYLRIQNSGQILKNFK